MLPLPLLLGDGIKLRLQFRSGAEIQERQAGRVESDGSAGLLIYDQEGQVLEELPSNELESWEILDPLGNRIAGDLRHGPTH